MKWNEMKWNEMKWNEMKWNEMKWNEMKWNKLEKLVIDKAIGRLMRRCVPNIYIYDMTVNCCNCLYK